MSGLRDMVDDDAGLVIEIRGGGDDDEDNRAPDMAPTSLDSLNIS